MGLKGIPIIGIGPGSQPAEADGSILDYIDMPQGMTVYQQPLLPEPEEICHLFGAMEIMDWVQTALQQYQPGQEPLIADISTLDAENRDLVNQILGEGEVGIKYSTPTLQVRMQESVLAGVWRTFYLDSQGQAVRDLLEIADVPVLARLVSSDGANTALAFRDLDFPAEVMNALPILTEIQQQIVNFKLNQPPHVINLTLLPLTQADIDFLNETLGRGPVNMISRGYGDCRIISTAIPHVWWVRYYNSTGTLILNTLEVVDIPGVACAAPEDLQDAFHRLNIMLEPYREMSNQ